MANLGYVSTFNINGNELSLKDAALTEIVNEIIEAIGANNGDISDRINNLHDRSFDALIKISSQNESEIASIQDGMYKLQYVTITGEGDNAIETLNNSAILIQKGTNQYLYKDGQISSRTKENSTWGNWITFEGGVTSVNGQTGAVTIDVGVTSFNGQQGAIAYSSPVQSVNGQTGAVTVNVGVTSFNGATGAVTYTAPVTSVDGQTGAVTISHPVTSVNGQTGVVSLTIPTVPTTSTTVTENDTNPVSGGAVYNKFADLIGAAPAALDTLAEIANALNNDADLAGTLTTQISNKVPKVSNPTADNFASFNSDGTIKDSGHSHSDYITSIKTINNESLVGSGNIVISGLPLVSAADNGKILMVVNGQWQLVSPSVLYSGNGVPNNANGNNGDLYMQTD